MKNNTTKNRTGNAQVTLAQINAQIAELQSRRVTLAEPLKNRYAEMVKEIGEVAGQIRELDPSWKPEPTKPKAETRIAEVITAKGQSLAVDEIIKELAGTFNSWKIKNTLKKKSTGPKALFAVNDGRYSLKAAA